MPSPAMASPLHRSPPGRLHAILLAGMVPLFLGALLSDIAYYQTYQIQWSNFASWLIAGALLFCGLALLFSLINLVRATKKAGSPLLSFLLLLASFVFGLVNAFEHAKDAWAAMPSGLVLSIIVSVLACVAAWMGLAGRSGATT